MKFKDNTKFYKSVLTVAVPIMLQNGISNVVNMLDNIMVGKLNTEAMSGVSIVNQLLFVLTLCLFGTFSGAGIMTAQFYGRNDKEGVRDTFRFKLIAGIVVLIIATTIFVLFDDSLIGLYLHQSDLQGDLELTLSSGKDYMRIMLYGLPPMMLEMCYSSTLRECGETKVPMIASTIAVFVNLCLNWVLIFGNLGSPALGVTGAAIATVISRYIQAAFVIIWSHRNTEKAVFAGDAYKRFSIPGKLAVRILLLAAPLIINETLWSYGVTKLNQIYSYRGLPIIAALNIQSTIANVFNIFYLALGNSVGIIVGQLLGAGKVKEGKETAYKIIAFSTSISVIAGLLLSCFSGLFPELFKTYDEVKELAKKFILVNALCMPLQSYLHATYFTIRSGGKTLITFLFDSVFLWVIPVPTAWLLTMKTGMDIVTIFLVIQLLDVIKCVVGTIIMKSGIWAKNITESIPENA